MLCRDEKISCDYPGCSIAPYVTIEGVGTVMPAPFLLACMSILGETTKRKGGLLRVASLLRLGKIVATSSALLALEGHPSSSDWEGWQLIARHQSGDWGEVSEVAAHENDLSVEQGYRIFSAYTSRSGHKVWIITHRDRSTTMLLLPDEYLGAD